LLVNPQTDQEGYKLRSISEKCDFNNEMQYFIQFFPMQGRTPKEIHALLTETLAYSLPGQGKDLSAPL
jgi:hypothetical protein